VSTLIATQQVTEVLITCEKPNKEANENKNKNKETNKSKNKSKKPTRIQHI